MRIAAPSKANLLRRTASAVLAAVLGLQPVLAEAKAGYFFRLNGTGEKKYLTIKGPATVYGHLGSSIRARYTASGGDVPYLWGSPDLPNYVQLDGFGTLSGVPETTGSKPATIVVSDGSGASAAYPIEIEVLGELQVVGTADLETGVGVENATVVPSAIGSPVGKVTWVLAAGDVPPGMAVDADTGAVTGVPTKIGLFTMSVQASDTTGATAVSASFTIKVADVLTVRPKPYVLFARQGVAYRSPPLTVEGGYKTPGVWTLGDTALPAGLDVDHDTGSIVGLPTTATPRVSFAEGVVDANKRGGPVTGNITVLGPLEFPADDGTGAYEGWFREGVDGQYLPPAPGAFQGGTWSIATGTLPYGLWIDPVSGLIHGNPTRPLDPMGEQDAVVTYAVGETATGASTVSPPVTIHVYGPLTLGPEPDLVGVFQAPMSSPPVPYTGRYAGTPAWGVYTKPPGTAPTLPTDVVLDALTGALSGTPTVGFDAPHQIAVTDRTGTFPTNAFRISSSPKFTVSTVASATARVNVRLTLPAPVTGPGYAAPLVYGTRGALPPGLAIDPATGVISGTPTASQAVPSRVVVTATDGVGYESDAASFALKVLDPLAISFGADPGVGSLDVGGGVIATHPNFPVSMPITIANQPKGPVTWSPATFAGVPAGLRLVTSADGLTATLVGRLADVGDHPFAVAGVDATGAPLAANLDLRVVPPISATGPTVTGRVGVNIVIPFGCAKACSFYGSTVAGTPKDAVGGASWQPADDGSVLPPGLGYDVTRGAFPTFTGKIVGSPKGPDGTYQMVIGVHDALDAPSHPSKAVSVPGTATIVRALDFSPPPAARISSRAGVPSTPSDPLQVSGNPVGKVTMVETGNMPDGLKFDATTGVFSGTATMPGDWAVRVSAFDAQFEATPAYDVTIHVENAILVGDGSPIADYTARAGTTVFAPPAPPALVDAGAGPLRWSLSPPVAGVMLDAAGTMSGAPLGAGTTATRYLVQNAAGAIGYSVPFNFVALAPLTLAALKPTNYVTDVVDLAQGDPVAGAVTPFSWQITNLPPGLAYDEVTGRITGSPTLAGTYDGHISMNDAWGAPADTTFHWIVYAQVVVDPLTTPAPDTYVGAKGYDLAPPKLENARGTVSWAATVTNPVPPGMRIDPVSGHLTGVPTTAGTYPVAFQATDGGGFVAKGPSFPLTVRPALALTPVPYAGRELTLKSAPAVTVVGGTGISRMTLTGAPGWLSVTSNGALGGTPPTGSAGTYTFTLTDADKDGELASATVVATILPSLTMARIDDQDARVDTPFALVVPTPQTGARQPLTWSTTTLPGGLTFDPVAMTISGKPTLSKTTTVSLSGVDADGATFASNAFAIAVRGPLTLTLGASAYFGHQDRSLSVPPPTIGGNPKEPYALEVCCTASGPNGDLSLPVGLHMTGTDPDEGNLGVGGTPQDVGFYTGLTYTIVDATGGRATSDPFTLTVNPPLKVTDMADATGRVGVTQKQVQAPAVSGNPTVPLKWGEVVYSFDPSDPAAASCPASTTSTVGGRTECYLPLPDGLTLDPTVGFVSGTPTVAGSYAEQFAVGDASNGFAYTNPFTITILPALSSAVGEPDTTVHVGTAVDLPGLALDNAPTAPLQWSVTSGTLAAGLSLDPATGEISGTPTAFNDGDASSALTLKAVDATGATYATTFKLQVYGPLAIAAMPDLETSVGHGERVVPALSHAAPTASYAVTGLPAGFVFSNVTGVISGSATAVGGGTVTVTATDGAQGSVSTSFAITVRDTLAVANTGDQITRVGQSRVVAQGSAPNAVTPAKWSTAGGFTVPNGLTIDPTTGRLAGSATTVGTGRYAFRVVDGDGRTAVGTPFNVTVNSPLTIGSAGSFALRQDVPAVVPAPSVGNSPVAPVTWAVETGSSLPAGFALDPATGNATGTPSAAQAGTGATFSLTVTDAQGSAVSNDAPGQPASLTIYPPLRVTTPAALYGHVGQTLSIAAPVVTNTPIAPLSWSASTSASNGTATAGLPDGLTFDQATGAIRGTPTAAAIGTNAITVSVRDATNGVASSLPFTITILPAMTMAAVPDQRVHNDVQHVFPAPVVSNAGGSVTFAGTSSPSGIGVFSSNTGQTVQGAGLAPGSYVETVTATDASGATASRSFTVTVGGALSITAPTGNAVTYDVATALQAPVATNVVGTAAFALASGTLPSGLTLSPQTGVISGTTTQLGSFPVTLSVTDDSGSTATSPTLTIVVSYGTAATAYPSSVAYLTTQVLAAMYDASATSTLTVPANGSVILTYPDPIQSDGSLDTDGTGTKSLTYNNNTVANPHWVAVSAGSVYTASQFRVVFGSAGTLSRLRLGSGAAYPAALASLTGTTLATNANAPVSQPLDALMATANASGPETWAVTSGTLPDGLSIVGSTLQGIPTTTGLTTVTLAMTDARGVATAPVALTVNVLSSTLASTVYPSSVSVTGQTGDFTGAAYDGSTATRMPLSTATSSTSATFYAESFAFPSPTTVSTVDLSSAEIGTPTLKYCSANCASGSPTMTAIALTSTSTTATLTTPIASTLFTLSGTTRSAIAGVVSYVTKARLGYAGSYPGTLPSIAAAALQRPVVGSPYAASLDALMTPADVSGPKTWAIATGTLPTGLTFDPSAGTIAGTPTASGDAVLGITLADSRGIPSASMPMTLSVQSNVLASTAYPASATSVGTGARTGPAGVRSDPSLVAIGYDGSSATSFPTVRASDNNDYAGVRYTFAQPVSWDGSVSSNQTPLGVYYNTGTIASPVWTSWSSAVGAVTSTDFEIVNGISMTTARLGYGSTFPAPLPSLTAGKIRPTVGVGFSASLDGVLATLNASGTESWTMTGSLPAGLTFDGVAGTISGTPAAIADTTVTLTLTDGRGIPAVPVTLTVSVQSSVPASSLYATSFSAPLGGALVNLYDQSTTTNVVVGAGAANALMLSFPQPVTWDGTLDAETSVGTYYNLGSTSPPTWTLWTAAAGAVTSTDFRALSLNTDKYGNGVNATLTRYRLGYKGAYPAYLPSMTTPARVTIANGASYSANLDTLMKTANASGTETWTLTAGALPTGVGFDPAGVISGKASATGSYSATFTVTDARGIASAPVTATFLVQ